MPDTNNEQQAAIIVDRRINTLWERLAIAALGLVLSFTVYSFKEQATRIENLEQKVIAMDKIKTDRGDLKEVEERLSSTLQALKSDLIARQDIAQANILSRIDMYMQQTKK